MALLVAASCGGGEQPQAQPKYEPTWDSLQQYEAPQWFEDAKYGIFIHWGVYAVPAYGNEWYPRRMYLKVRKNGRGKILNQEPDPCYTFHIKRFGPQKEFGYKDFVPMFKAGKFDPGQWADLFQKSGAKYVVPVAEHHDGFAMYDSSHTEWDAVEKGPKRDIVGELKEAVEARGMKFGASSHYAFNRSYYTRSDEFDTADPAYKGLYGEMRDPMDPATTEFMDHWYARTTDIIDKYQPEVLWFDFGINVPEFQPYLERLAAYYYNKSAERGREPVLQYKSVRQGSFPDGTAVLDIERGRLTDIRDMVWQTDTSISKRSWGYIENDEFKSVDSLVDVLVDIVSKNGVLLLNVGPKADGTIPDEAQKILLEIGKWLELNGEAIYGTRPWKVFGEGPTKMEEGAFSERKDKPFTPEDIRFTTKGDALYAIALGWPGKKMTVKSLASGSELETRKISAIRLLGADEDLEFTQDDSGLVVETPAAKPGEHAFVFKILF
jgi:alpha-L-fucosidase